MQAYVSERTDHKISGMAVIKTHLTDTQDTTVDRNTVNILSLTVDTSTHKITHMEIIDIDDYQ
ncbi:MAG: hypothetical protein Q4A55_03105 [Aerococcus sp.]|nr:hypothetical protein [Aerococcus sp.]